VIKSWCHFFGLISDFTNISLSPPNKNATSLNLEIGTKETMPKLLSPSWQIYIFHAILITPLLLITQITSALQIHGNTEARRANLISNIEALTYVVVNLVTLSKIG
jgi:hypothetical protein